jgi:hypothetical protein
MGDSEKAYKRKFEEWGLTKNVPKDEGLFMVKKREQRREEGKETVFWRRRRIEGPLQLVPDDKVDRIADRYSHDLNSYHESGGRLQCDKTCSKHTKQATASTPENIEYSTPETTSFANTVARPQVTPPIPTTTAPAWGIPSNPPHVASASGYTTAGAQAQVPGIPSVQPLHGASQPQYYQQPPPEETSNMIGHTNPAGLTWDPWSQQYF